MAAGNERRRRIPLASRFVIGGYLALLLGGIPFQALAHSSAHVATPAPAATATALVHVAGNVSTGDRADLVIELPAAGGSDTYTVTCDVPVLDAASLQHQAVVSLPPADAGWLAPEAVTGHLAAVPHSDGCEQGEGPHLPETPEPEIVLPAPESPALVQHPTPAPSSSP